MSDWFRNRTAGSGISHAFITGNAKVMSTGINNPDFAIDQISGGSIATPDFNGPEWDPKSIGTMHLISQYFCGAGQSSRRFTFSSKVKTFEL